MSGTKHQNDRQSPTDDLEEDPGIGQSEGSFMTGIDPEEIKGENTILGDTENDSTANDGVPQKERERTNG